MSSYSYRAIATCFLNGAEDAEQATRLIVQAALTNSTLKSAIPDDLATDDSDDLFVEFKQYVEVNGLGEVVVSIDTDEGNLCTQFFDYIVSVLATIHTGDCLEINWSGWDSREGISGGCDRYGPGGNLIDQLNDCSALNDIAELLCGSRDGWSPTLLHDIQKIVRSTGRQVFDNQEATE